MGHPPSPLSNRSRSEIREYPRGVAQAAPHHLAHDLPVQGGEVHHVQVEDQVDGIVLRFSWSDLTNLLVRSVGNDGMSE